MIRPLNPLDMAALISFAGSAPNEAAPREKLAVPRQTLNWTAAMARQWLGLAGRKHNVACLAGRRLLGLASIRQRAGPGAWEVDGLYVGDESRQCCPELLEGLDSQASKLEADRLFLRLRTDSPLLDLARASGFNVYVNETLYLIPSPSAPVPSKPVPLGIRPRTARDDHALFRLFNAANPDAVRVAEGLTPDLWRSAQERHSCREFVCEADGEVEALLRVYSGKGAGCFDVCFKPAASGETLRVLAEHGQQRIRGKQAYCVTAPHQAGLLGVLSVMGAVKSAEYTALVKHLAVREAAPSLLPSHA